jgi:hypothetical protein
MPDPETFMWHFAREEFHIATLYPDKEKPVHKGAWAVKTDDEMVFGAHVIWTRTFGATPEGNVLHILRVAIRGEEFLTWTDKQEVNELVELVAACLRRAQEEAEKWDMREVQIWNPGEITKMAIKSLLGLPADQDVQVVEREQESIASLRWNGEGRVEWWANEKFGWC